MKSIENISRKIISSSPLLQTWTRKPLHLKGRHNKERDAEESRNRAIKKAQEKRDRNYPTLKKKLKIVDLPSPRDNSDLTLKGFWSFRGKDRPTVILFHGMGSAAPTMDRWPIFYDALGFNVLMPEYRGYGISPGEAATSYQEGHTYLDAEAAVKFVLNQGCAKNKIISHGYSLGGSAAASTAKFLGIQNVILNHTFTTYADVVHHACRGALSKQFIQTAIGLSYRTVKFNAHPEIENAKPITTDGFNSLKKIEQVAGSVNVLVIRGKSDSLMKSTFAKSFLRANYPNDSQKQKDRLITTRGGHSNLGEFFLNRQNIDKMLAYLESEGHLPSGFATPQQIEALQSNLQKSYNPPQDLDSFEAFQFGGQTEEYM